MEKKSRKSIIIGISVLLLVTVTLLGLTYAYYRTRVIGNDAEESISVTSKSLQVEYQDGNAILSTQGLIEPGFTATKEFSVENTGDGIGKYSLKIDNVRSDFLREEDWTYELYAVSGDGAETLITSDTFLVYDFYLSGSVSIDVDEVQSYKLKVKYENLEAVDQSEDMGASLSFRVTIDDETGTDTKEMTSAQLLATAVNGEITLDNHVILTDSLTIPSNIKLIDLNDHVLTVKGIETYSYLANPIIINNSLEIKDGVLTRYKEQNVNDYSLEKGPILYVTGENASLTLNDVVVHGNDVLTGIGIGINGVGDIASVGIFARNAKAVTINSSVLRNNISSNQSGNALTVENVDEVTIENSIIFNNYCSGQGYSAFKVSDSGEFNIINTQISKNISVGRMPMYLSNVEQFNFDKNSVIKNNKGATAGGLYIKDITYALVDGTIDGNEVTKVAENGGGLYTTLSSSSQKVVIGPNAKIINNISNGAGAGIYVNSTKDNEGTDVGVVEMNGGLISGNVANGTPAAGTLKDGGGAGIYVSRGVMKINGGTIENNRSTSGIGDAIIVSNAGGKANGGQLEITGGTVLGSIEVAENYGSLTISGGTYSFDVSKYLISGKTIAQNGEKFIVS